ncbi:MAG: AMP-binding protein [Rhodobiaceae bacterium]|nr:AMP-binding protein [Rhodobiaceae bacterium]MCC0056417.1 AMP-binding protein [Rhodobiaceae bacterium]
MPELRKIYWEPDPAIIAQSNLTAFLKMVGIADFDSLVREGDANPGWLMENIFRFSGMRFYKPYEQIFDATGGNAWARWCVGGTTNMVLNCIDKHRDTPTWNKTFLVWEGEDPSAQRSLTYRELDAEVCRLAGAMKSLGIGKGDVVGIYMPNLPETFIAFFAVIKIGAIVMPLFSGFGAQPIVTRLNDGGAKAVIAADGAWRRGSPGDMKGVLDEALGSVKSVEHVIVVRHLGDRHPVSMQAPRDHWWHDLVEGRSGNFPTEEMEAEAPAVLLYTSGTSGKPKGCVWTHVGFLGAMIARDVHISGDFKSSDRFFWMSDMGWMVGALCACAPSMFGGSLLIAEGVPDFPDTGRFWRLIQDHKVTYLGIAPTLVRGLMRYGDEEVESYDLSSLRITLSGGEGWTDAPWLWFFRHVCKSKIPIINNSGGTEVSGDIVIGTVQHPMKVGSIGAPALGMGVDIVDEHGRSVGPGQVGELVLRQASIGMTKSLWKDDERYLESYWKKIPGLWVQGDLAMRDEDGLYFILGRSDDTMKVSGKRTGPSEIESIVMGTGKVVEVAAIGVPDPVQGQAIVCVCTAMPGVSADDALAAEITQVLLRNMGVSFRPKQVIFVSDLPKTRNMKIMRRIVRAVFLGDDAGDLSSLVNPEAVAELRMQVSAQPTTNSSKSN